MDRHDTADAVAEESACTISPALEFLHGVQLIHDTWDGLIPLLDEVDDRDELHTMIHAALTVDPHTHRIHRRLVRKLIYVVTGGAA